MADGGLFLLWLVTAVTAAFVCAVQLRHGTPALHVQKVLHAGLWSGEAVHQHQRGGPPGKLARPRRRRTPFYLGLVLVEEVAWLPWKRAGWSLL